MNLVTQESKFVTKPLGIFILVIILFGTFLKIGLGQINSVKAKIDEGKKNERLLASKVNVLRNVESVLSGDISLVDVALPSRGVAIYGMSQIKNQASVFGLLISNLRIGSVIKEESGISRVSIFFEVDGNEQSVYDFLDSFSRLLPIMRVDKVSINKTDDILKATITVNAYSGELPKKIPSLAAPITDLSNEEIETLKEILIFTPPQFMEPAVFEETPREDPFN